MTISLKNVELCKVDLSTRMPFRYGIATVTGAPYLLVFSDFEVDGKLVRGIAADVLPPKWFTKQPEASVEDEIEEMLRVIRAACDSALQVGEQENVFRWWQQLYQRQMSDSALQGLPPLLKGFGVSLLERTAIDATCRRHELSFHEAVRVNLLGIRLGDYHHELAGGKPADFLPEKPQATMSIRHTVGLSDPLTDADIPDADRLDDGLPQSLEACLQVYGIRYLKIKLPASTEEARSRLHGIGALLHQRNQKCQFTLDGNEFYTDPNDFRQFWEEIHNDPQLKNFLQQGLVVVEQPLHRDVALADEAKKVFNTWPNRPSLIIDESDAEVTSLRRALETGYAGTSHKNCKGVLKGLANACLIKFLNNQQSNNAFVCTGEDLMNIGPVALLQDLAVGAVLGLAHMERNGHHYIAGLQQMPTAVQHEMLLQHGDLYHEHTMREARFPTLAIAQGKVQLGSVNRAPFGYALDLDPDQFDRVSVL